MIARTLSIRGAREHNLRALDLDLPRESFLALAGVSGSGKSSLAFDTLYREGQRRYLETLSPGARRLAASLARPRVDSITGLSPALAIDQRSRPPSVRTTVGTLTEVHDHLALLYARLGTPHCPRCARALETLPPAAISERVCREARGQRVLVLAPLRPRTDEDSPATPARLEELRARGVLRLRVAGVVQRLEELGAPPPATLAVEAVVDRLVPDEDKLARVHEAVEEALLLSRGRVGYLVEGQEPRWFATARGCADCGIELPELEPAAFSFRGKAGACPACAGSGTRASEGIPNAVATEECAACRGTRLRPEALAVRWKGRGLEDWLRMPIERARDAWSSLALDEREQTIGAEAYEGVRDRLARLEELGLGHLHLARSGATLSGGEAQRVRLAAQLSARLRDVLYVLDEPSAGLHPSEVERLVVALRELRDRGNTVLVVEHDAGMLRAADWLVELGPGAGAEGGHLIDADLPVRVAERALGPTGEHLARGGDALRDGERPAGPWLALRGARGRELKGVDVEIPLGALTVLAGVSGSGKSTLLDGTLVPALAQRLGQGAAEALPHDELLGWEGLARVLLVDARPIGRGPRSDVATFTGLAPELRTLLAASAEARMRGWGPSRFSTNVDAERGGGRCPRCEGAGWTELELGDADPLHAPCDECGGARFSEETRRVRFAGRDISAWLETTVAEAAGLLREIPSCRRLLDGLLRVGLGYLRLGQRASELSGGEAQRLKLAVELGRRPGAATLYAFDEPTRGLHARDVEVLLRAFSELVARGDTVVVVEHDPNVLARADWVIELGPGAGEHGGTVIARGLPKAIAGDPRSVTGRFLAGPRAFDGAVTHGAAAEPASHAERLRVRGARVNNLRGLDVSFELGRCTAVTGPSGSGKSSLLLGVVHAEGRRRFLESLGVGARRTVGRLARAAHDGIDGLGPTLAVDAADREAEGVATAAELCDLSGLLARLFAQAGVPYCPRHSEPAGRSHPEAVVKRWVREGAGKQALVVAPLAAEESATVATGEGRSMLLAQGFVRVLVDGVEARLDQGWEDRSLGADARIDLVLDRVRLEEAAVPRLVEAVEAAARTRAARVALVERGWQPGASEGRVDLELAGACSRCGWSAPERPSPARVERDEELRRSLRLPDPAGRSVAGESLDDWLALDFAGLATRWSEWAAAARAVGGEVAEIAAVLDPALRARFDVLARLGLEHLEGHRPARGLSGGELRRARLAGVLGSGLSGVTYVLDEPSAGLHAHDLDGLWSVLASLVERDNTVLLVEHEEASIERADRVVELGPGGGRDGGTLVAASTPAELREGSSVTARALRGEWIVPRSAVRRGSAGPVLRGARTHNLLGVDLEVRLGRITAVSGVSGAGKTALVLGSFVPALRAARGQGTDGSDTARYDELEGAEHFDELVVIDATPLGRSRRSTVAGVLGVAERLRGLWARLPEARARGYNERSFSASGGPGSGACTTCRGTGEQSVDRAFLAEVRLPCPECEGRRFRADVLECRWRGLSIADALRLEVGAAQEFFAQHPGVLRCLAPALAIGLDSLSLSQPTASLSGGELRRLKIARHLARGEGAGASLFVLDEPTSGLHAVDVERLCATFDRLSEGGHGVLLVEHRPQVLWRADHIVDLGPGGGARGGRQLFAGTPRELAKVRDEGRGGATGALLRRALERRESPPTRRPNER